MAYEINPHAAHAETPDLQGLSLRKGDDQIRTGVPAHKADCLAINRDEGFHPSFAAKWLGHWPVLHSPITAPESAFIKERV